LFTFLTTRALFPDLRNTAAGAPRASRHSNHHRVCVTYIPPPNQRHTQFRTALGAAFGRYNETSSGARCACASRAGRHPDDSRVAITAFGYRCDTHWQGPSPTYNCAHCLRLPPSPSLPIGTCRHSSINLSCWTIAGEGDDRSRMANSSVLCSWHGVSVQTLTWANTTM